MGRLVDGISMILLLAMCGATVMGVLDRFVLGVGLAWPEEVSRFLLIWVSLLAAAIPSGNGSTSWWTWSAPCGAVPGWPPGWTR